MRVNTEGLAEMFIGFIIVIIIAFLIGIVLTVVDVCGSHDIEDLTYECVITHMDVDDGTYLVSVVSNDSDFAKTIRVTSSKYATMQVGNECVVHAEGYYYPTRGNVYTYKIVEISNGDN